MNKRIRIFFDMEFTGLHQQTTPVSIGLISDRGLYFYAEFNDYDSDQVDQWVKDNVISNMLFPFYKPHEIPATNKTGCVYMKDSREYVGKSLGDWLEQYGEVEIWSDCLAYDWVLFCELFGGALKVPKNVYYIPFDICTLFYAKGIDPDVSREEFVGDPLAVQILPSIFQNRKHNALWDAYIIRRCFQKLQEHVGYAANADAPFENFAMMIPNDIVRNSDGSPAQVKEEYKVTGIGPAHNWEITNNTCGKHFPDGLKINGARVYTEQDMKDAWNDGHRTGRYVSTGHGGWGETADDYIKKLNTNQ